MTIHRIGGNDRQGNVTLYLLLVIFRRTTRNYTANHKTTKGNLHRILPSNGKRILSVAVSNTTVAQGSHYARPFADKLSSIGFETKLFEIKIPWSEQTYKTPDPKNHFLKAVFYKKAEAGCKNLPRLRILDIKNKSEPISIYEIVRICYVW